MSMKSSTTTIRIFSTGTTFHCPSLPRCWHRDRGRAVLDNSLLKNRDEPFGAGLRWRVTTGTINSYYAAQPHVYPYITSRGLTCDEVPGEDKTGWYSWSPLVQPSQW